MRKLLYALLLLTPFSALSQTDAAAIRNKAELQTNELVSYFQLDAAKAKEISEINLTCETKIAALEADRQMPAEAVTDGIQYNRDLREELIGKLLTPKQFEHYMDFRTKSVYNQ